MKKDNKNVYAVALKIIGGSIIILGIIGSLILGDAFKIQYGVNYVFYKYNYYLMTAGIFSSVITGVLIMGMGELIQLIDKTSTDIKSILLCMKYKENNDYNTENEELPEL